jgi:hypothetical protein
MHLILANLPWHHLQERAEKIRLSDKCRSIARNGIAEMRIHATFAMAARFLDPDFWLVSSDSQLRCRAFTKQLN